MLSQTVMFVNTASCASCTCVHEVLNSPQYPGVPQTVFMVTWSSMILERPKSAVGEEQMLSLEMNETQTHSSQTAEVSLLLEVFLLFPVSIQSEVRA